MKVSKRRLKRKVKRFFTFVLLILIILACLFIYFNGSDSLNKYLSKDQIKSIKDEDKTLAASFVSSKDFKSANIDRYISYSKSSKLDTDKVIKLVNNDIDKLDNFTYDDIILSLLDEEYYLYKNTIRYMKYYSEHKDLKASAIICNVNSNIDYKFYTNNHKVDLSKGNLILVNKYYSLDKDYKPELVELSSKYGTWGSLTPDTYEAFKIMVDAASKEGIHIYSVSPYRDYALQTSLYNRYVKKDGKELADTYSARPGSSEHQTGLAMDINSVDISFANTKEGKWLANNSYKYGFILRYPKGKEYITGYQYEPWHFRYVGEDVAKYIYEHDITFEEYYAYFIEK